MDPLAPVPQFQPQPQPTPSQPWYRSKKALIIAVVVLVVLVVGIIAIAAMSNKKSSLYTERPGYETNKMAPNISDPDALVFKENDAAVKYEGNAVVQACNILTLEDIEKEDMLLRASSLAASDPLPAISRTYVDGEGKGKFNQILLGDNFSLSPQVLSLGHMINNCEYSLEAKQGSSTITVSVAQPFTISPQSTTADIKRYYKSAGTLEGMELFVRDTSKSSTAVKADTAYILRKGTSSFYISLQLASEHQSKKQALLQKAAKQFGAELTSPRGNSIVSYDSPLFDKSYARACDLLTNDDIRQLTGKDALPLVYEKIASAVGRSVPAKGQVPPNDLHIQNECERQQQVEGEATLETAVRAKSVSFKSAAPAGLWVETLQKFLKDEGKPSQAVSGIGDKAIAYADEDSYYHVLFQKGRIVVDVTLSDKYAKSTEPAKSLDVAVERLSPIVANMAERVKQ